MSLPTTIIMQPSAPRPTTSPSAIATMSRTQVSMHPCTSSISIHISIWHEHLDSPSSLITLVILQGRTMILTTPCNVHVMLLLLLLLLLLHPSSSLPQQLHFSLL
jgi:hypothetical protein